MNEIKDKTACNDRCVSRRKLLKTAGAASAAAILVGGLAVKTDAATGKTYPQVKIASIKDIEKRKTYKFDYPLVGRKSILLDCGCPVEGGIGPKKSIVAYSMFCTHLGCSVDMDAESEMLVCECHQTVYNPKESGRVVQGPAPNSLPMVSLDMDDSTGDIYAVGVAGLIYGLRNNLLDGEEVR